MTTAIRPGQLWKLENEAGMLLGLMIDPDGMFMYYILEYPSGIEFNGTGIIQQMTTEQLELFAEKATLLSDCPEDPQ